MKKILLFSLLIPFYSFSQKIEMNGPSNMTEAEIRSVLATYPSHLLKKVASVKIEALESSDISGKGGYNWIIVSGHFPKSSMIKTIHHELSSTFLQSYDAFKTYNLLSIQFKTINDSYTYIGRNAPIIELTEVEKDFFAVNTYARTTFENDYNMICEELFTNPNFLKSLKPSTALYKKTMLVIEFYNKLDAKFTLEFFQNIK